MKKLVCLLLHIKNTSCAERIQKIVKVDTDVVIQTIAKWSQINSDELWIAFGSKLYFSNLYTYVYMKLSGDWIHQCAKPCQFSMLLLVVT